MFRGTLIFEINIHQVGREGVLKKRIKFYLPK